MVSLDRAVIARLETHGEHFELLVDPDLAFKFKHGEKVDIEALLAVNQIFKDAKKGDKSSPENVLKTLGTSSFEEAVEKIIKKGEIQLTTEMRRKIVERRRKQIVNYIARNAINPLTKAPHPPHRIEKAMEEARVHIDINKSFDDQLKLVIKSLRPLIPIKFEERKIAVKIPPDYTSKTYPAVRKFGDIKQEEWLKDGSYAFVITLPAGAVDEFFRKLNKLTRGNLESKIL